MQICLWLRCVFSVVLKGPIGGFIPSVSVLRSGWATRSRSWWEVEISCVLLGAFRGIIMRWAESRGKRSIMDGVFGSEPEIGCFCTIFKHETSSEIRNYLFSMLNESLLFFFLVTLTQILQYKIIAVSRFWRSWKRESRGDGFIFCYQAWGETLLQEMEQMRAQDLRTKKNRMLSPWCFFCEGRSSQE